MTEAEPKPPRKIRTPLHHSVFARLRRYFLAGILVTAPVSITLYLTLAFLKFVDSKVASLFPSGEFSGSTIPGLGLLMAISFFITTGWFAKNYLGKTLISISEYILDRMPVINTIYSATKQVFETVMGNQSKAFREVVMFQYPREGIWTIGFVAGEPHHQAREIIGEEIATVFLPTAPSPTNGIILFIPRKDLHPLSMTVEEAFKWVLSGGILSSPQPGSSSNPTIIKEKLPL